MASSSAWDQAFGWGDHSQAGYLTSFTELDPIFSTSPAFGISGTNISNWNSTYTTVTASSSQWGSAYTLATLLNSASSTWNQAYSWGDHSTENYIQQNTDATLDNATTTNLTTNTLTLSGALKTGLSDGCVEVAGGVLTSLGVACGTGGGGLTNLNGLTSSSQSFATSTSGGLSLNITSSGGVHTFSVGLQAGRTLPLTASTTEWANIRNLVNASSSQWGSAYTLANLLNSASSTWNAAHASTTALTPSYLRGLFNAGTGLSYGTTTGTFTNTGVLSIGGLSGSVATSSLGLGNNSFIGLSDTPGSYNADRVLFTNAAGNALTDSANFTYNGSSELLTISGNLATGYGISLGSSGGIYASEDILTAGNGINIIGTEHAVLRTGNAYVSLTDDGIDTFANIAGDGVQLYSHFDDITLHSTNNIILTGIGNVGIGTTTPSHKLTVAGNTLIAGNATTTGNLVVQGADIVLGNTGMGYISSASGGVLILGGASNGTGENLRFDFDISTGLDLDVVTVSSGTGANHLLFLMGLETMGNLKVGGNITDATWQGNDIDISDYTNLGVTATGLSLSGDNIALTAGYSIPLTSSTSEWTTAYSWGDHATQGYLTGLGTSTFNGNISMAGHIIPAADITYDLGSPTSMWRDVYIGPGSLYINGKKVLEDVSDTITLRTDHNQNLAVQTSGIGSIHVNASSTGGITMESISGNINITSASGNLNIGTTGSGQLNLGTINQGVWHGTDVDISDYTNLTVSATGLTLNNDAIELASGYAIPLTASTTEWMSARTDVLALTASSTLWDSFYNTPSSRLTAGTGLYWSGNTLNASSSADINYWTLSGGNVYRASGNVGIGTSTPAAKLDVQGSWLRLLNPSGGSSITSQSVGGEAIFAARNSANAWTSGVNTSGQYFIYDETNASIPFRIYPSSANSVMSINGSNVGIGTTTPNSKLHLADGYMLVTRSETASQPNFYQALNSSGSGFGLRYTEDAIGNIPADAWQFRLSGTNVSPLIFSTFDSTPILTMATSGNIGIGTTTPNAALDISSTATGAVTAAFFRSNPGGAGAANQNTIVLDNLQGSANFKNSIRLASNGALKWSFGNDYYGAGEQNFFIHDAVSNAARLLIDPDGNVGIGTTSPNSILNINTGLSGFMGLPAHGSVGFGNFSSGNTAPSMMARSDNSTALRLISLASNSNTDADMNFDVRENDNTDFATLTSQAFSFSRFGNSLLTILRSGNVGIGTSTPSAKLSVQGTIRAESVSSISTGSGVEINYNTGTGLGKIQAYDRDASTFKDLWLDGSTLTLATGGASRVTILPSSGNVGIGTTTPQATLHLGTYGATLRLNSPITGSGIYGYNDASGGLAYSFTRQSNDLHITGATGIGFQSNAGSGINTASTSMYISSAGNVGIGTTTPASRLSVFSTDSVIAEFTASSSAATRMKLNTTGSNKNVGLSLAIDGITRWTNAAYLPNGTNYDYTIWNDALNSPALLIDGDTNNIGIGTLSPAYKLHLASGTTTLAMVPWQSDDLVIQGGLAEQNGISIVNGSNKYLTFVDDNIGIGQIGYYWNGNMNFLTDGTERMVINATGNVGIGTTSPLTKLDVKGSILIDQGSNGRLIFNNYTSLSDHGPYIGYSTGNNSMDIVSGMNPNANGVGTGGIRFGRASGSSWATTMVIDGSGLVGIGTSTPTHSLTVGAVNSTVDRIIRVVSQNNVGLILEADTDNLTETHNPYVKMSQDGGAVASIMGMTGGANIDPEGNTFTGGHDNALVLINQYAGSIQLGTNGAPRLSIVSSGNVGIGALSPSAQLHTTGTVRFANFGAGTLQTDASGNLSVSSDTRLKDLEGTFDRGLEAILGIEPIMYRWNAASGYDRSTLYAGFSAQNVEDFIPEAVGTNPDGFLSLSDRPLLAAVINAVKEIYGQLTTLSDKIAGFADSFMSASITATDRICVGDTCVTEGELKAVLDMVGSNGGGSNDGNGSWGGSSGGGDTTTGTSTASTTPPVTSTSTPPATPVLGCMDPLASNFAPAATEDDGSCVFPPAPPDESATTTPAE